MSCSRWSARPSAPPQLTRQLLAFSRQQVLDPRPLDLGEVAASLLPMLRRLIGEDIEIAMLAAPGLPAVLADRSQIEQVVLNLSVNARDAMPDRRHADDRDATGARTAWPWSSPTPASA